ncbi:hypothetical protein [Brevibacterium siliguriense]|uniref:hypothetical protein n=1 Tax=Brevibacterium siliguriense TaxID=1136497 RepID=UPI000B87F267|nr:hypothetical protein [Brevibacterium siliguriense]
MSTLRSHHLKEAVESVVVFSTVAGIFWLLDFATGASPSVPQLLVTVTVPAALLKEYVVYASAVKRLGFIDVPKAAMADTSASYRH